MTVPNNFSSRKLPTLIRQVIEHAATEADAGLNCVRLESDGSTLYAVATDRTTLAVARERLDPDANPDPQPFSVSLTPRDAAYLAQIADVEDRGEPWEPPLDVRTDLALSEGDIPILGAAVYVYDEDHDDYVPHASAKFIAEPQVIAYDWRELVRERVAAKPDGSLAGAAVAMDPRLMARWKSSGLWPLHFRITGKYHALVVTGPHFIGLQMPAKPLTADEWIAMDDSTWGADLGTTAGAR